MLDILARLRRGTSADRRRAVRPVLEPLEGRMLLYATTGDAFTDGRRLTFSLIPDGTTVPGGTSNLFATLDAKFSRSTWVGLIEDAFAEWENVANVNFSMVGDNGASDDSGNIQQGSTSFGDIRIGAFSEGQTIAATTVLPPHANGGSNSGDIFLNSDVAWQNGTGVDLETVVLHEIGHALGLAHSTNTSAVMYGTYSGVNQVPTADDIAGVDSIWGARAEDAIAQKYANFSQNSAADVTSYIQASNHQALINPLDVAKSNESYWFKFTTPPNTSGNLTVTAQSTWLSELSPWVQLYSSNFSLLSQANAANTAFGATVSASIGNMTPSTTYYVRIDGSSSYETGTGNYALLLNMGGSSQTPASPPGILVYATADQGGGGENDTFDFSEDGTGTIKGFIPTDASFAPINLIPIVPNLAPAPAAGPNTATIAINVPHPTFGLQGRRPPQEAPAVKKPG